MPSVRLVAFSVLALGVAPFLATTARGSTDVALTARTRTDLVLLAAEDRVTGEIIRLEAASLSVRTRSVGTVEIDWPDVRGIVSIQYFEVERADGTRFRGRLDVADAGGALVVRTGPEDPETTIPLAEVVGIDPLGTNLWRGRRGHLDLGWSYSQADADSSLSLDAELALRVRRMRWTSNLSSKVAQDEGGDRIRRDEIRSLFEVPATRKTLGMVWGLHERNDDLDLQSRDSLGAAWGWLPVSGARGRILLAAGGAESHEAYFSLGEEHTVASGVLFAGGQFHRFGQFGTKLSLAVTWLPVLSGPDRQRTEVRAYIRQKISHDFWMSINSYYSHDTNPPTPAAPGEDWGWTTSIGWYF